EEGSKDEERKKTPGDIHNSFQKERIPVRGISIRYVGIEINIWKMVILSVIMLLWKEMEADFDLTYKCRLYESTETFDYLFLDRARIQRIYFRKDHSYGLLELEPSLDVRFSRNG